MTYVDHLELRTVQQRTHIGHLKVFVLCLEIDVGYLEVTVRLEGSSDKQVQKENGSVPLLFPTSAPFVVVLLPKNQLAGLLFLHFLIVVLEIQKLKYVV